MTVPRPTADERPYSPGLEGVVAAETTIARVDGASGRLMYRGHPIGHVGDAADFDFDCHSLAPAFHVSPSRATAR